jgi:lipopolysaccharide export system protein LptA
VIRTDGVVSFAKGSTTGTAVGMSYDHRQDVLSLANRVTALVRPAGEAGGTEIAAGNAEFARGAASLRFTGGATLIRGDRVVEAASALVQLSADQERIESMGLRGGSRLTVGQAGAGTLRGLSSRDMDLKLAAGSEAIEHALLTGQAVIELAGESGTPGGKIAAETLDIGFGLDGAPTALTARRGVDVTLAGESGSPARTIRAASMDGAGEPGQGLSRAHFAGEVEYRERGVDLDRTARAATLDAVLRPGLSAITEARLAGGVRFVDGRTTAHAAAARYEVSRGAVELSGSEPGALAPRVVSDRLAVDATRINLTFAGPALRAEGAVKGTLRPPAPGGADAGRLPRLLDPGEPVQIVAGALDYDGAASKAVYTGGAQLWQGERTIKGESIALDDRRGDLTASGSVMTVTLLDEAGRDRQKTRVRSVATAREFRYDDATRRATYDGAAHISAPERDLAAARIELWLSPSGDTLDRADAYDAVTLRDPNRRITGDRLAYAADDDRYVVTGQPVRIVDACGGETTGRTVTYLKTADTLVVDGSQHIRTETRGRQCP